MSDSIDHALRSLARPRLDLAFSGCGALGVAHVGAIEALRTNGHVVSRVAGTSAGSLAAVGVAFGLTTDRMLDIATKVLAAGDIADVRSFPFSRDGWGLCAGERLRRLVAEHIGPNRCLGDARCPLGIVVANVSTGKALVLRSDTHPDVLVADAVTASCAIPVLFSARRIPGVEGVLVDGGVVANLPARAFAQPYPFTRRLAIRVRSSAPAPKISGPLSFARALVSMMMSASNLTMVDEGDEVVDVQVNGDAFDFQQSEAEARAMFETGHDAVVRYLRAHP